jgi:hypothetical protein
MFLALEGMLQAGRWKSVPIQTYLGKLSNKGGLKEVGLPGIHF